MLQLTPQQTIYIANIPIDFRKGIDGLAASVRNQLELDPLTGGLFMFYNRARTTIKILTFDGQGFWLHTKRLSQGKFKRQLLDTQNPYFAICHRSLYILIHNGDPKAANLAKDWRPLKLPS
jgi:transposase